MTARRGETLQWGAGRTSPADAGAGRVEELAAGSGFTLGRTGDRILSWGDNLYGQLGQGTIGADPGTSAPEPVRLPAGAIPAAVTTGTDHGLAGATDGRVFAWGKNTTAQLSLDPSAVGATGSPVVVTFPEPVHVVAVAAGAGHSLVLDRAGRVWAWGDNSSGQLGVALAVDHGSAPVPLVVQPTPVSGLPAGIVAIGAGDRHSLAIDAGGQVWAWGDDSTGQLGEAVPGDRISPVPVATGVTGAAEVEGGRGHSLARLVDGTVLAWGDDSSGQVGGFSQLSGVIAADAGSAHNLAVLDDGRVLSWGSNDRGQLGRTTPSTVLGGALPDPDPKPVEGLPTQTAVIVAAGLNHSAAALAPKVTVDPGEVSFGGVVEIGTTVGPAKVTLSNRGPGPLDISAVSIDNLDDFSLDEGCHGTLAKGASCTVSVSFHPRSVGPRTATLHIEHDAFDGATDVPVAGVGGLVAGQIAISTDAANLTEGVPASPSGVPLTDVPLQPGSPAIADAQAAGELPAGDLTEIGELPAGDLTEIGDLPIGDLTEIGDLPAGDLTEIGDLPIGDLTEIGDLPIGDLTEIAPKAAALLDVVSPASVPLSGGWVWDGDDPSDPRQILSASDGLHGQPLQQLSVRQVLADPTAAARLRAVPIRHVGWAGGPLGGIGVLALLVGDTPLSDIPGHDWCAQLAAGGYPDCGSGLGRPGSESDGTSASPVELQMAGVPFGTVNLSQVTLGQLPSQSLVNELLLARADLYRSDLGSIAATDIPAATRDQVVDCSAVDCTSATLYSASAAGAIRPDANIGHLGSAVAEVSLGRLVLGLLGVGFTSYGAIPLDRLGLRAYGGNEGIDSHRVSYRVDFRNGSDSALPDGASISVRLPEEFLVVPGSADLTVNGEPADLGPLHVEGRHLSWSIDSAVPAGALLTLGFDARPGFTLGTFTVDEVRIEGDSTNVANSTPSAAVRVIDGLEPDDATGEATPIEPTTPTAAGQLRLSHISRAGDRDLFSFPASAAPAGSLITVHLDHQQEGDADLALLATPGLKGEDPLRAEDARGMRLLPDRLTGLEDSGLVLPADVQSDVSTVAGLQVLGISHQRGTAPDAVSAVALTPSGADDRYVIEVVGYNGAFSDLPYTVRATVTPSPQLDPLPPRTFPHDGGDPGLLPAPAAFTGAETVFLTAPTRRQALYGEAEAARVSAALSDARLADVIGSFAVLPIDAGDGTGQPTPVQQALAAWDADPGDVLKANAVVAAVNALVDGLLDPASLRHLVVVGGDIEVPFARLVDGSASVSERMFAHELALSTGVANPYVHAAAVGRLLSDDGYADLAPTPIMGGHHLYLPDLAIGRLVETPAEIAASIDQFLDFGGVVDPGTGLTTSAEPFLDDMAAGIHEAFADVVPSPVALTDSPWGRADLLATWTAGGGAPDIISFNGHSDQTRTSTRVATSAAELVTTSDLAGADLSGQIAFSVGCHTGLPLPDGVVRVAGSKEWSQTLLGRGAAAFAGPTAYGLGSRSTVALTERLMLEMARGLETGSLARALADAKAVYLTSAGAVDELDAKALMATTYFGMPHLRLASAVPAPPAADLATGVYEPTGHDATFLRRQSTDASAPGWFALERHDGPDGSWWTADGRALTTANRPMQPLLTADVTRDGLVAHGVMVSRLRSVEAAIDPVIPRPTRTGGIQPERELQPAEVAWPASVQTLRNAGGRDVAQLVTGLFRSAGRTDGRTTGQQLLHTDVEAVVLYAPPDVSDFTPPTIHSTRGIIVGGVATFTVEADDPAGMADVNIVYREEASSDWRVAHLRPDPSGTRFTGSVPVTADEIELFAQAADRNANVAVMSGKAWLLRASVPPAPTCTGTCVVATVTGTGSPANPTDDPAGWLHWARVSFAVPSPHVVVTARINGGAAAPVTGPITLAADGVTPPSPSSATGDGFHTIDYEGTDGSSGTIVVRLDGRGPDIELVSPAADGSTALVVGSTATADYSCADRGSGVASCEATVDGRPLAPGDALPTTAGTHVVVVVATDRAGNESSVATAYQAAWVFEGFLEPVKNRPAVNDWQAGQTVPLKWRLRDASGQTVVDAATFVAAGSYQIECGSLAPPSDATTDSADTVSGLSISGETYHYGWKTRRGLPPSGWQGTCRRFVLSLADGSQHLADFRFI